MSFKSVLVVDDSEAEQFIIRNLVEEYDDTINVVSVHDGREALDFLEKSTEVPEVIFLDVNMPRMDGIEFLKKYSELNSDKAINVVICSSSVREKQRACEFKCVIHYVEKPLCAEDLAILSANSGL